MGGSRKTVRIVPHARPRPSGRGGPVGPTFVNALLYLPSNTFGNVTSPREKFAMRNNLAVPSLSGRSEDWGAPIPTDLQTSLSTSSEREVRDRLERLSTLGTVHSDGVDAVRTVAADAIFLLCVGLAALAIKPPPVIHGEIVYYNTADPGRPFHRIGNPYVVVEEAARAPGQRTADEFQHTLTWRGVVIDLK